jgi:hypothetical protein
VSMPKANVRLRKTPPWCVHTIWCDESGATGNELLDANQEHFVYASVALEPREAQEIRLKLVRENSLQGLELKGKNLCGHSKGRQAISQLIELVGDRVHLVVHHKKYALAAKFFEYIFEPLLADKNWLFYKIGFHRFISNLLFVWAMSQDLTADQILGDFARAMRTFEPASLPTFPTANSLVVGTEDPLSQMGTFCMLHKERIAEELLDLKEIEGGSWTLDLTSTSLFSVLSYWGEQFDQLAVYCDDAKPLQKSPIFQHFVNRQDKAYQTMWGYERLLTPNLAHPVNLVDSHSYPGVQLADAFASACRKALQNRKNPEHQRWIETLIPRISQESVWHDVSHIDVNNRETAVNMLVLHELMDRSVKKEHLLTDIEVFIYRATMLVNEKYSVPASLEN